MQISQHFEEIALTDFPLVNQRVTEIKGNGLDNVEAHFGETQNVLKFCENPKKYRHQWNCLTDVCDINTH